MRRLRDLAPLGPKLHVRLLAQELVEPGTILNLSRVSVLRVSNDDDRAARALDLFQHRLCARTFTHRKLATDAQIRKDRDVVTRCKHPTTVSLLLLWADVVPRLFRLPDVDQRGSSHAAGV